jgi:hypothetical protein
MLIHGTNKKGLSTDKSGGDIFNAAPAEFLFFRLIFSRKCFKERIGLHAEALKSEVV